MKLLSQKQIQDHFYLHKLMIDAYDLCDKLHDLDLKTNQQNDKLTLLFYRASARAERRRFALRENYEKLLSENNAGFDPR